MTAPPRSTRLDDRARTDRDQHPDHHRVEPATEPLPASEDEQRLTLSATQIMASMAAAVTAAIVGSKLGVAGTVIGAGLASVISVVGGAIFGHSILLTRRQVKRAVQQVRGIDREQADHIAAADDRTVVIPAVTRFDLSRPAHSPSWPDHSPAVPERRLSAPERGEPRRPRPTRRKLGAGLLVGVAAAAAIFAGSLAAVTIVETVKGSPLSGGDSGGLSVLGGNGGTDSGSSVEAPATTTQVTAVSTVTATVTSQPVTSRSADSAPATSEHSATTAPTSSQGTSGAGSTSASSGAAASSPATSATAPNPAASTPAGSSQAGAANAAPTATGSGSGADSLGK